MNDLDKIDVPSHDERQRDDHAHQYWVASVGHGQVVCYRKGLQLIDFYRTIGVLAKDHKPEGQIK